jgi:hypothetical protein
MPWGMIQMQKNATSALLRASLGQLFVEIFEDFVDKELAHEVFFFW